MAYFGSDGEGDKYRSYIDGEGEKNTTWRRGVPNYDVVNKLFEEGRTKRFWIDPKCIKWHYFGSIQNGQVASFVEQGGVKRVWEVGSLEEQVQRLVKTWEMEMFHKVNFDDHKCIDPKSYTFSLNGRKPLTVEGTRKLGGSYNVFLQTSLPENLRYYNPDVETVDTSHVAFTTAFPRGFAVEILQVYSGPPVIVYRFRHWGYMEGPFKGLPPTGELVEFFGMSILELNEEKKIVKAEFFYDRGELLGNLLKGAACNSDFKDDATSSCPFLKNTS